ncbi:MAG: NAD(+)/NADH kinase [Cystobacterineae bacterium]|nr:NAD(+)/NADH kinase [Cystobacterineae bacterium]
MAYVSGVNAVDTANAINNAISNIVLVAKPGQSQALVLAKALKAQFPRQTFWATSSLAAELGWNQLPKEQLREKAELVLVLGGDGTLIQAACLLAGRPVPILGVNLGSLGFLTEIAKEEVVGALQRVLAGDAQVDSRMKLSCELYRAGERIFEDQALNDVVVNKGVLARMVEHEAWINGELVAIYKSDGIICSTPTGSTAYCLAAGGPIVHPAVDCLILTPICPHALTQRPIVVTSKHKIRIVLRSEVSDVFLTVDGRGAIPLKSGDWIDIQKADNRVFLVRNPSLSYFGVLHQKLRWGER